MFYSNDQNASCQLAHGVGVTTFNFHEYAWEP